MVLLMTFVFLSAVFFIYRLYSYWFSYCNINPWGKFVLITGCDSGIGYELAIELDKKGFNVYAGVLREENKASLLNRLSSRAVVLTLDITKKTDIDEAYTIIKSQTNTLHALINNAATLRSGFIDWQSMESYYQVMNVIFFGHVAITKKFLPLLIEKRGSRVINTSSVSGIISLPGESPYSAAKYALESFSDCLRREMRAWNLHVSIIEPGAFRTGFLNFYKQTMDETWESASSECKARWGDQFYKEMFRAIDDDLFVRNAENPSKVVDMQCDAVCCLVPRIRYRPGWQSPYFFFPVAMLPARIADVLFATITTPAGVAKQQNT